MNCPCCPRLEYDKFQAPIQEKNKKKTFGIQIRMMIKKQRNKRQEMIPLQSGKKIRFYSVESQSQKFV
jgi:hypothetical protein